MIEQMQGVIRGKHIELEREPELPSGSPVIVKIEPLPLDLDQRRQVVESLCGAWADDDSLVPIFVEIEERRARTVPRQVDFDASS